MANRLSKIYTRTGDDGSTGLGDGTRVDKEHVRVEAYGSVDETNCAVGMVLAQPQLAPSIVECLTQVQHDLFDLGGELCIPGHRMIGAEHVSRLELELDGFNADLPPLKYLNRLSDLLFVIARVLARQATGEVLWRRAKVPAAPDPKA